MKQSRCAVLSVPALLLVSFLRPAHSAAEDNPAKTPEAAAILDRYVQVTGGHERYKQNVFVSKYSTVTREDGTSFNTAFFHSRDGRTQIDVDAGAESQQSGVSNGTVWEEFSKAKGARIVSGKPAERKLAEARGFDEDDWRERFPRVKSLGLGVVNGKSCYHLKLQRVDGSALERYYDQRSGLLVREISTQFDEAGKEEPVTTDIEQYDDSLGILHPSLLHVKAGHQAFTIRIDSQTYSAIPMGRFEIPHEVARAAAAQRNTRSLPNAVDLIDRFIEVTGGKQAYQAIKTEAVKATISLKAQNLEFPVVMYAAKNRAYASFDIPSLGKFEFGSDGQTAWERSVVLGPRLDPASRFGGLLGPDAAEVLGWTDADLNLETVSKSEVNGSPCYQIRMGGQIEGRPANTACFDVETGYLVKTTTLAREGTDLITVDTLFGEYRAQGSLKVAHHVETNIAGQAANIDIREVAINGALPDGIFDLPPDVRALKEKRQAELTKEGEASQAPILRKKP